MKIINSLVLCIIMSGCSGGEPVQLEVAQSVLAPVSKSEQAAILNRVESWGKTNQVDKITRISIDTFHVDIHGITYPVTLRDDGIITEGNLTSSEIESIKQIANAGRQRSELEIRSIKQENPVTVEVRTGSWGASEYIKVTRSNNTWVVKSVVLWIE